MVAPRSEEDGAGAAAVDGATPARRRIKLATDTRAIMWSPSVCNNSTGDSTSWQLAVGSWQRTCRQRPTANGQRPTANRQLPTANGQPPTANRQLPTANCQPPTPGIPPPVSRFGPPMDRQHRRELKHDRFVDQIGNMSGKAKENQRL